jgi:hypothetical protein
MHVGANAGSHTACMTSRGDEVHPHVLQYTLIGVFLNATCLALHFGAFGRTNRADASGQLM